MTIILFYGMKTLYRIKNEAKMPIVRIELAETKTSTIIYEPEISN